MKVVDTVRNTSAACFGEEVRNLRGRVDDGCADDTDRVRDVGTSNVRLQERSVYLTRIDDCARLGVEGTNVVLR